MEPNIDRMQWSVVALLGAIVIGGIVLLAFPKISGKIANNMDDSVDKAFKGETPSWVTPGDESEDEKETEKEQEGLIKFVDSEIVVDMRSNRASYNKDVNFTYKGEGELKFYYTEKGKKEDVDFTAGNNMGEAKLVMKNPENKAGFVIGQLVDKDNNVISEDKVAIQSKSERKTHLGKTIGGYVEGLVSSLMYTDGKTEYIKGSPGPSLDRYRYETLLYKEDGTVSVLSKKEDPTSLAGSPSRNYVSITQIPEKKKVVAEFTKVGNMLEITNIPAYYRFELLDDSGNVINKETASPGKLTFHISNQYTVAGSTAYGNIKFSDTETIQKLSGKSIKMVIYYPPKIAEQKGTNVFETQTVVFP